ncbi:hypothetical protein CARUB_v10025413mg [Capsella rubella]|uniref:Uncharacterized protein n=1 Tax=Capsella rubella TaxID=81985 RepID=R0HHJ7_9BRAS|nr:uncharacterized protein LOC17889439 [Capsella rubella]XP_006296246.1 uncharacterized protein LOC17888333 [Capsella rubella]EOA29036.1 hypothetical protein CARUB_v10025290mg [Capsella rubella]EOA29144.1 hypothetical protein CARUB_v10025413mg [Capsella rubella]
MKSATLLVVSCVLMFLVMHNAKVEAEEHAPLLVEFIPDTPCNPNPAKAAQQCLRETHDKYYTHCKCKNQAGGHDCSCLH